MTLLSEAADSIADGDVISAKIRGTQNWSLLPMQAMMSSVIPGDLMRGYMGQMINFPQWLGKNSSRNKVKRILEELNTHMHLKVSCDKDGLNLDYRTYLKDALHKPLLKEDGSGVQETLDLLENYDLLKEDFESLLEISQWPNQKDVMAQVATKTKSALTRKYNTSGRKLPYAAGGGAAKVKRGGATGGDGDMEGEYGLEGETQTIKEENEESDDDISNISSIKAVKPKAAKGGGKKAAAEPSSKGKGRGKKSK